MYITRRSSGHKTRCIFCGAASRQLFHKKKHPVLRSLTRR